MVTNFLTITLHAGFTLGLVSYTIGFAMVMVGTPPAHENITRDRVGTGFLGLSALLLIAAGTIQYYCN